MWKRIHQLEMEKERSLAQKKERLGRVTCKQGNATDDPANGVDTVHQPIKMEEERRGGETDDDDDDTDGSDLEELDNFRCKSGVR
ncbi:unnamed protein product [Schistocephalus solidus]|uniref:Uncharacterized protein n=1 Tax=Schistocephalus solidus TaxID=70667 RepID=A0A183TQ09_SCHSO|nr:unnamed protein product [Schistocephalus solidus]